MLTNTTTRFDIFQLGKNQTLTTVRSLSHDSLLLLSGATNLPEIIPTNGPSDVLPSQDAKRPEITGRSNIFIVAAMVNAVTPERSNEWVTISNFSGEDLNLEGWTLSDTKRKALSLNGEIKAGESMRIQPLSKDGSEGVVLSNSGGTLVLADGNNRRIDSVKYGRALTEGLPVIFHMTSVE